MVGRLDDEDEEEDEDDRLPARRPEWDLDDGDRPLRQRHLEHAALKRDRLLPHVPDDCTSYIKPLYAPDYERFWALVQDLDLVVNQHGGTGSPDYGRYPVSLPIRLIETPFFSMSWHNFSRDAGSRSLSSVFAGPPSCAQGGRIAPRSVEPAA